MKHALLRRMAAFLLALLILTPALSVADEETDALFDRALADLLTPDQLSDETGFFGLHTGDSAFVPCVSPGVIPYDEIPEGGLQPTREGVFSSSDESVVTVSDMGLMTGVSAGEAEVTCVIGEEEYTYNVTVGDDQLPHAIKNYIYVLNREFYTVKRARLPRYNQYAKWYYKKRKEVGWCAVFTAACANAAGIQPLELRDLDKLETPPEVMFVRQGEVGHQYDGFSERGRFVDVPKPGYLVIYADMSKSYRTTHIASITDVKDLGGGLYALTTVEGNMSNSVKSYSYIYDSTKANNHITNKNRNELQYNMSELPQSEHTDPLVQYELHTDHWAVFGFCQTWQ